MATYYHYSSTRIIYGPLNTKNERKIGFCVDTPCHPLEYKLFETYKVLNRFSFPVVVCDEGLLRAIILPRAVIRQPGECQRRCQQPRSPVDGQIASADAGVVDSFISSELLFRYADG